MWKIRIKYDDKSKITLTGKGKDIDIGLAWKYYDLYVAGRACSAEYQRYPKKDYPEITLQEKIKELGRLVNGVYTPIASQKGECVMDDKERQITDLQRYLDGWRRRWHKQHKTQVVKAKKLKEKEK